MKQNDELLTQTQIANKIGISKATLSKWISKNNVSPVKEIGNKKFYDETLEKQYINSKKLGKNNGSNSFSSIEFLKDELSKKQKENELFQDRINKLEKQLDDKNNQIYSLADRFATLADQAQKLNLADKKTVKVENKAKEENNESALDKKEQSEPVKKEEPKKKKSFWSRFR